MRADIEIMLIFLLYKNHNNCYYYDYFQPKEVSDNVLFKIDAYCSEIDFSILKSVRYKTSKVS